MTESRDEFRHGYIAGWKQVVGKGRGTPAVPMASAYVGGSTYEAGFARVIEDATKGKPGPAHKPTRKRRTTSN
jgi:hypothetical protein